MSKHRLADRDTLVRLNDRAIRFHFNRTAEPDLLADGLDPEGTSILTMLLFDHTRMWQPEVAAPYPMHHRVKVLAKVKDTMTPEEFMLDVTAIDWDSLPEPEEVDA